MVFRIFKFDLSAIRTGKSLKEKEMMRRVLNNLSLFIYNFTTCWALLQLLLRTTLFLVKFLIFIQKLDQKKNCYERARVRYALDFLTIINENEFYGTIKNNFFDTQQNLNWNHRHTHLVAGACRTSRFSLFSPSGSHKTVKAFLLSFIKPFSGREFIVQLQKLSLLVVLTLFVSIIDSDESEVSDELSPFAIWSLFVTVDHKFLPFTWSLNFIAEINYICNLLETNLIKLSWYWKINLIRL